MPKGIHHAKHNRMLGGKETNFIWNLPSFKQQNLDDAADAILMNDEGNKNVAKHARMAYWKKKKHMKNYEG
jgi:hypothetical protein